MQTGSSWESNTQTFWSSGDKNLATTQVEWKNECQIHWKLQLMLSPSSAGRLTSRFMVSWYHLDGSVSPEHRCCCYNTSILTSPSSSLTLSPTHSGLHHLFFRGFSIFHPSLSLHLTQWNDAAAISMRGIICSWISTSRSSPKLCHCSSGSHFHSVTTNIHALNASHLSFLLL